MNFTRLLMTCINMHGNRWELPNLSMFIMSKT